MAEQIARRVRDVVALLGDALDDAQACRRVALDERGRQLVHDSAIGDAEDARHVIAGQLVAAEGDHLVEQAHCVAHRAGGLAGQHLHPARAGLDLLEGEHLVEALRDGLRRYELEVVALAAREDGDRDLLHLGRREDELHVRRRLLERLQEGVPRRRREHVDLVDHVDLEAVTRRAEAHPLLQTPDLVDAVVAGAVDLLDVEILTRRDLLAGGARVARRRRGPGEGARGPHAVEALGEQARARRLADSAYAREQECVRHPPRRDGVREGTGDVVLPDQVLECLRSVLPG